MDLAQAEKTAATFGTAKAVAGPNHVTPETCATNRNGFSIMPHTPRTVAGEAGQQVQGVAGGAFGPDTSSPAKP
jgi:hypothetical protein